MRYLRSKKRSGFLSLITALSVIGVGLGVTVVIVVLSVMDGFETELKKRLMATEVHIQILPTGDRADAGGGNVPSTFFSDQPAWNSWIHSPGIEAI
jgi:ABC-type lipoprotein release transport system permease subunit